MTKQALNVPGIPVPPFPFSQAVTANGFVFISGQIASNYESGIAPEAIVSPQFPFFVRDGAARQARYNFQNIQRILEAAGSSLQDGVWLNQSYPRRESVVAYHDVRREFFGSHIPPSTSIVMEELMLPESQIVTDMIGIVPGELGQKVEYRDAPDMLVPAGSNYVPAVSVSDYVFIAGQMAADFETGVAEDAKALPNVWNESQIRKETSYTLGKVLNGLKAAGADASGVVKAQVYLSHIDDLPRMDEAWRDFFGDNAPARTVIPTKEFGVPEGRIEINAIALKHGSTLPREQILAPGVPQLSPSEPHAVRAGSLLFLSTQLAADEKGLLDSARVHPRMPYFSVQAEREMRAIIERVGAICQAAGTSIAEVVRIQCHMVDLGDLPAVFRVMSETWPVTPPTFTAIRVPAPLAVPECRIQLDVTAAMP